MTITSGAQWAGHRKGSRVSNPSSSSFVLTLTRDYSDPSMRMVIILIPLFISSFAAVPLQELAEKIVTDSTFLRSRDLNSIVSNHQLFNVFG